MTHGWVLLLQGTHHAVEDDVCEDAEAKARAVRAVLAGVAHLVEDAPEGEDDGESEGGIPDHVFDAAMRRFDEEMATPDERAIAAANAATDLSAMDLVLPF